MVDKNLGVNVLKKLEQNILPLLAHLQSKETSNIFGKVKVVSFSHNEFPVSAMVHIQMNKKKLFGLGDEIFHIIVKSGFKEFNIRNPSTATPKEIEIVVTNLYGNREHVQKVNALLKTQLELLSKKCKENLTSEVSISWAE